MDVFSGSGSIGIEALSRGALRAYFIENAPKAVSCIQENLLFTKFTDRAIVIKQDVCAALAGIHEKQVDVIFMDPPYKSALERTVLERIAQQRFSFVGADTKIIVEADIRNDFSYAESLGYEILREKEYKTNKHVFLRLAEENT